MLLTATEKIIWTVPAPSWARRLVKEWRSLAALSLDGQDGNRRAEIQAQLPPLHQYRFTFISVTIAQEDQRDTFLKGLREDFESEHGVQPGQYSMWYLDKFVLKVSPRVENPMGEILTQYQAGMIYMDVRDMADWATFMSCLTKMEERQVDMLDAEDDPPWTTIEVPDAWNDYHNFIKAIPRQFLTTAIEICNDLNPGVWEMQMDEDSKNLGGVNVRG